MSSREYKNINTLNELRLERVKISGSLEGVHQSIEARYNALSELFSITHISSWAANRVSIILRSASDIVSTFKSVFS